MNQHAAKPAVRAGEIGARARGFTLLELLVVLAIASLMLTLVPLAFSSSVDLVASRAGARDLTATLQRARSQAVARNRVVDVMLDAGRGHYALEAGRARALPARTRLTLLEVQSLPEHPEQGYIRFYPDGSSSGGVVRLDDGARRYRIEVQWLLGHISARAEGEP